jgi:hypothetical protein
MSWLLQSVFRRLSVLSLVLAIISGAVWAWRTTPWYLPPQQYFVTVSPDASVFQRHEQPFDISFPYHRSLLVSGSFPMPFGVSPTINQMLMERGVDFGSSLSAADARLYSQYCGFIDDKEQAQRGVWREATLCNSAKLKDDLLSAAVTVFKDKVDAEIADYRLTVVKNVGVKLSITLASALGFLLAVAAGMWVVKGDSLEK